MHDAPSSPAYHVLRTGRVQLREEAPRKPPRPVAKSVSRGSARVLWKAPYTTIADPGISHYRIAWRPGGNTSLGYRSFIEVCHLFSNYCDFLIHDLRSPFFIIFMLMIKFSLIVQVRTGDVIQYTSKIDENGIRRTVPCEEMMAVIVGLTSEIPYEFKVVAVNSVGKCPTPSLSLSFSILRICSMFGYTEIPPFGLTGEGVWSEPTEIIILKKPLNPNKSVLSRGTYQAAPSEYF